MQQIPVLGQFVDKNTQKINSMFMFVETQHEFIIVIINLCCVT